MNGSSRASSTVSFRTRVGAFMFALAAVTAYPSDLAAQATVTVTFLPAAPASTDLITAEIRFVGADCWYEPTTTVSGSIVQTTLAFNPGNCLLGPPPISQTERADFGPLPAGTYTYQLYFRAGSASPEFGVQQTLVIAPALAAAPTVPTLTQLSVLALATCLALVGVVGLGGRL